MFVVTPKIQSPLRQEEAVYRSIQQASDTLTHDVRVREEMILQLFDAKEISRDTPVMASGWVREMDSEIISCVTHLLTREEKVSLLEIGAGTTWGRADPHFGIPGLARTLKLAFPSSIRIVATDFEGGYDMFVTLPDGLLIHHQYRDDRPPLGLEISSWKNSSSLAPISQSLIERSMGLDQEFAAFVDNLERYRGVNVFDHRCRLYIRPRVDSEIEAHLFGVQSHGRIDYYTLVDSLIKAGRRDHFDLVYGRHLCPIFSQERIRYLEEKLPPQLQQIASNSLVHFDCCRVLDGDFGDLIFRHHSYF